VDFESRTHDVERDGIVESKQVLVSDVQLRAIVLGSVAHVQADIGHHLLHEGVVYVQCTLQFQSLELSIQELRLLERLGLPLKLGTQGNFIQVTDVLANEITNNYF